MTLNDSQKCKLCRVVAALLVAALLVQCGLAMRLKSPAVDEFVHLPVGYSFLRGGDFLTDPINPPLMRIWAALPLLLDRPRWDLSAESLREAYWPAAYHFMESNADRYQSLFLRARWMVVTLSVLLAIYVYHWAGELYGTRAGLTALFLYAFCPNLIAHSMLVTADLGGACFIFLTLYHFWKLRRLHQWLHACLAGAFLGLALLSKLSAVFLPPVLILLFLLDHGFRPRPLDRQEACRSIVRYALLGLVALVVLHLGYGGQGCLQPLGALTMKSRLLGWAQSVLPSGLVVPFPAPYVLGIDHALQHGADLPPDSFFLLGELSSQGWWYYFLVAGAVKLSLPILAAIPAACLWKFRHGGWRAWKDEQFLLVPALAFFVAISGLTSLNIGFRHVLMVLPLVYVWVSQLAGLVQPDRRVLSACLIFGTLWYAVSTVRIYPDYLAYFNELAGGPDNGHLFLSDSNLDWGQDLIQLGNYLRNRGNPEVSMGYFGRVDPSLYGIRYRPLKAGPSKGLVVLSVTFLQGRPYVYPVPHGGYAFAPANFFAWLREHEPVARIGHTLWVYDIP